MDDSHLLNAIKFLSRHYISYNTFKAYILANEDDMGEGAQMAFEQECMNVLSRPVSPYLDALEKEAEALKLKLDEEAESLVEVDEVVAALEEEISQCEKAITISSIDELYQIKNKIVQLKEKITEMESSVNPYLEPLKELQDVELEPIDMDIINELDNLLKHQNYLVKLLTKKDSFIRKNLLNKNLSFLNHRLKEYLIALGLPHKVEFTHEMTAHISQFGRELDFGNLSSGQKARVNLALSFSFSIKVSKAILLS